MDSITHIVLGACVGEALLGGRIGKKAMLMGAVAQSIPDIDFVASFWMNTVDDLIAHRGITHSIAFVVVMSPIFAVVSNRSIAKAGINRWILFFAVEMLIHLFLDAFNNYGIGWFEPFSKLRISFNTIYVADPLITLFPVIAFIILLATRSRTPMRRKWWFAAVFLSSCYLLVCVYNKLQIDRDVRTAFKKQGIVHEKYFTTPAPLQSFLWMVVAGDKDGFHVGYRSVLDSRESIRFEYFPTNEHLLKSLQDQDDVKKLKSFSQGFYTIDTWGDTLVFNDLRFGQIIGWHDPKSRFVFHYFLEHPGKNNLIVQRGRFARWDTQVIRSFFSRIAGN